MSEAGEEGALGVEGFWIPGGAHREVVEARGDGHALHVRLSFGRGWEAIGDDRLRQVEWPAFALRHHPPGVPCRHATVHAADWVGVRLSEAQMEELAAQAGTTRRRPLRSASCPAAGRIARQIRRRAMARLPSDGLLDDALYADFAMAAIGAMSASEVAPRRIAMTRRTLDRVLDYVEASLGERITLGRLAATAKLSPFHFARAFKSTTGHAPYEYVRNRRLQRARERLDRTDEPLSRVAVETGFCSQSHFTSAFRNAMGVTPHAYRTKRGGPPIARAPSAALLAAPMSELPGRTR